MGYVSILRHTRTKTSKSALPLEIHASIWLCISGSAGVKWNFNSGKQTTKNGGEMQPRLMESWGCFGERVQSALKTSGF